MRYAILCLALAGCAGSPGASGDLDALPARLGSVVEAGFVVPEPPPVPPEIARTVEETTYPIEGATPEAIRASMNARTPFGDGTGGPHGFTTWSMRWTFDDAPAEGGCRVENVRITLDLVTTTYGWDPPPGVGPELTRAAREDQARLLAHERGHQTIDLLGAMDVLDTLRGRTGSCRRLRAEANAAAQAVLDDIRAVNRAYDAATQSGTVPPPGAQS